MQVGEMKRPTGPDADETPGGPAPSNRPNPDIHALQGRAGGESLYRLLVDAVMDYAIFALDPTGRILTWNAGAQRFKGYVASEIIGKHFSIFYTQPDLDREYPAYELKMAKLNGRYEDEGWRLRKDGTRFWANVVITALYNDAGQHIGYGKVTRDLTERRAALDALKESEERFRLLVKSVRDYGIFMLDPNGTIASWNEGAQHIKGYTEEEAVGNHFSMFYTEVDIARRHPWRELEIATEVGRFEEEGWRVRKDGTQFWANVVITALRNPAGELVGFAKVTRDLTERKLAEERALADARRLAAEEAARVGAEERALELSQLLSKLKETAQELEQQREAADFANRAKSDFLAAMSHELRTPLNAIGGYVSLLEMGIRGPVNAAQLEDLSRIGRSQQHLLSVINDILNFSRIEAGQITYDIKEVSSREVVEAVIPMISVSAAEKKIEFVFEPEDEAQVMADAGKVEQILLNLLSNAVKFTAPEGRVTLRTRRVGDDLHFRVEDTGVGIPTDKLEAVFEPFVQVGRSLARPAEGTGLGLAISRDLARAMNGDLWAESQEGVGSVFTLRQPVAA